MMTPERLTFLIDKFSSQRIIVIGDFFLDKYLEVDPALGEPSIETGKTAHQVVKVRHSPGGAGNVVSNLSALGTGLVHAVGIIGDDGEGYELRKDLEKLGCSISGLYVAPDCVTPTYLKPRDKSVPGLAGEHNRYDTKNRTRTGPEIVECMVSKLDSLLPDVDAVIIIDQVVEDDCGVVTSTMRKVLSDRAIQYPKVTFWADSRAHIRLFRNVIIKSNQFEAVGIKSPYLGYTVDESELLESVVRLRAEVNSPVFVTRGASGMIVSDPEPTAIRGVRVEGQIDITGAGDSVSAGAVLTLACGSTLSEAALIGNLVASITIQQLGTTGTATQEQLPPRLELWHEQESDNK